ncbi:MAG: sodium-dependent transporter [Bacteroidaceae bacterium]|nr:sodium-dependent transporter [Bacteroidaceae bacterium]
MENNRENFGSKIGAILAAAGSAVGLGNVWRFPIETGQNGGAAFIIIYVICIVLLGLPIMMSEFLIGRYTHSNTAGAYRILSNGSPWKWVGRLGVFTGWFILCYYNVVGGWTLHYTYLSATNAFAGVPASEFGGMFTDFAGNPWIPTAWFVVFLGIVHFVITRGVQAGIEKFSKIMMPTLFIITIVLTVCSLCLPGASEGVEFLLKPDWGKVTSTTILQAMGQAFFSLSLGMGCLCTYASYFDKSTPLAKTAVNVSVIDTFIAIMAGFIIFPSVFNIGMNPNEVGAGASLTFISLPNVFQQAFGDGSVLSVVFSSMFYFLLFVAALTSAISLHEVATAYVTEEFHLERKKGACVITLSLLALGILCSLSFGPLKDITLQQLAAWLTFGKVDVTGVSAMNIFDMFDSFSGMVLLPLGGMFIAIFAGWVLDKQLYKDELSNSGEIKTPYFKLLIFSLRFIAPVAIGLVFLDQFGVFSFLK